jgi:transposase
MFNEQIDLFQGQLDVMQEKLRRICLCHPRQVLAWLSLPGVGIVNAATLIAYVGDGSRFSSPDQLLNYAGLVPKQDQSDTVDRKCHITKRGCSAFHRNIVQSGQVVMHMRPSCPITRFAYRKSRETSFKGKAVVAVANRLMRIVLSLLHHNTFYNPMIEDG